MHVYISGIGGVAMGPLARIARDLGHSVTGSNDTESQYTDTFKNEAGISVHIGQSKEYIAEVHKTTPIDWFVHTAALSDDHPELQFASQQKIKHSKRDQFINEVLRQQKLKLLAVSGTHGKTSTTGMIVWVCQQLAIPISYSVGTNLSFGPNGKYDKKSKFFVYEADEYDRNMLHFKPYCSIITALDYDHPDTYPSVEDYKIAFKQFVEQSHCVYMWENDGSYIDAAPDGNTHQLSIDAVSSELSLAGAHIRRNAQLVTGMLAEVLDKPEAEILQAINRFPGTQRRFEKLRNNLYTDYAHHPEEISVNIQAAKELNDSVVVVYQPHQNLRQHEVRNQYENVFLDAKHTYWLPTYLSRDNDHDLEVLQPEDLVADLAKDTSVSIADMDHDLEVAISKHLMDGALVICMSAGSLDEWVRSSFTEN